MTRGGRRYLLLVLLVSLSLLIGALAGARFLRSPAQIAAESAPPAYTVVTSAVESKRLASSVSAEGTVSARSVVNVMSTPVETPGYLSVLTRLAVKVGQVVKSGDALFEVAGSPAFAIAGSTPSYRALHLGLHGADVAQLQRALAAAGHSPRGDGDGTFGVATAAAVVAMYKAAGYDPPGAPVSLPAGSVIVLPTLPARVDAVVGAVGAAAGAVVMRMTTGDLVVRASVDVLAAKSLRVGNAATIYLADKDRPLTGTITSIATVADSSSANASNGVSATPQMAVVVKPTSPLPADLDGVSVRLQVVTASMGAPGLTVPVGALSADASGSAFVTVVTSAGNEDVPVRLGLVADGFAEVTSSAGQLKAGDQVRLGLTQTADTGAAGQNP